MGLFPDCTLLRPMMLLGPTFPYLPELLSGPAIVPACCLSYVPITTTEDLLKFFDVRDRSLNSRSMSP